MKISIRFNLLQCCVLGW